MGRVARGGYVPPRHVLVGLGRQLRDEAIRRHLALRARVRLLRRLLRRNNGIRTDGVQATLFDTNTSLDPRKRTIIMHAQGAILSSSFFFIHIED